MKGITIIGSLFNNRIMKTIRKKDSFYLAHNFKINLTFNKQYQIYVY